MNLHTDNKYVPIIGIQEFRKGQTAGRKELLYNELHGERHISKPHKHDFFIIVLFDRAKGTHNIDFQDYVIGDKQVHILFPGQVHKWSIEPNTTGYQLMIDKVFFDRFSSYFRFSFTDYINHPVISLSDKNFDLLKYEFDAIKDELDALDSLQDIISTRAAVIATIVSKAAEETFTGAKIYQSNPRLAKFNMLIDQFFKEEKLVAFYATKLNISANYLNILCKKNLNVSATQLIQQRVLLEAKRLLQSTDLSIKEIAFELGFVDHAYFSNFFKSQTGMTPTKFREE
ncbi:AraC-type DNA-binding protein [Algoriella xinjiangensis]|uniref:AraC-type DNA-binding protein n=1 Tax=Algoriella xinjiangensis TaxID=684065 RepID=A0A1I4VV95_9FLAO|nr:helix-turn-helix transcriptional regulator [Algoriella xinjiangensis]SFN05248.1 AraC-type DNA-binding protein [Algoriella xinjiangensis]VDH15841.1 Arabinose operon regulatory protein [Algoriella xinjiangensis]VDH16453.1 Arabinose operon regulatory protein [Algoriella xinjiangensis]